MMRVRSKFREDEEFIYQFPFVPSTCLMDPQIRRIQVQEKEEIVNVRTFVKEKSIFKPWREDTEKLYEQCAALDFKYWKLPRLKKLQKDPNDLKMCQDQVL